MGTGPRLVHVLQYGRALCPQEGIPRDWPEGHRWVPIGDLTNVTCPVCRERAAQIIAANQTTNV